MIKNLLCLLILANPTTIRSEAVVFKGLTWRNTIEFRPQFSDITGVNWFEFSAVTSRDNTGFVAVSWSGKYIPNSLILDRNGFRLAVEMDAMRRITEEIEAGR